MLPSKENPIFSIFIPNSFIALFSPQNKDSPNPLHHKKFLESEENTQQDYLYN